MSLYSDYMSLRKKRLEEESEEVKVTNKKTSSSKVTHKKTSSRGSAKASSSLLEDYLRLREDRLAENDDIAPVSERVRSRVNSDIAPTKKKEEKWYSGWLQKGAFDDGYDFGDITKTILGTTADVAEDIGAGIVGIGEKAVDAVATLAPYLANAQLERNAMYINPENMDAYRKSNEAVKKEISKFVAKDLYDEQKIAKKIVGGVTAGYDYEGASVLGGKADSVIQSGGQLLGTLGLQAVGVPWFLTTGATAFGSEAENAFNQGATYEEAALSSAIAAGAEILTEKISGGIKFGGKALDDALTDQIARGISNKFVRNLVKFFPDAVGEGAEEWITEDINKFGQWLTYSDEEELKELLFSEEAMQEKIEAFIGGAALGGVSNVGGAIKSAVDGVDSVTGRTNNEEAVVRKVYDELIAEAKKDGKVTAKEKTKIYDRVVKELEKGGISTDTIEELLDEEGYKAFQTEKDNFFKSDTMKSYNDAVASEEAQLKQLQEELDKLIDAPNTVGNNKLYDSIVSQMTELKENPGSNAIKAQLDQEVVRINEMKNQLRTKVHDMVKGTKLEESYNELIRSNEKYTADVSQYTNEHAKKTIQNILNSGMGDNTTTFHEYADWLAQISADKGMSFSLTNNEALKGTEHDYSAEGKVVNGFVTKDGITLNMDSPKALNSTVGHEVTHVLEQTDLYKTLQESVFNYAIAKEGREAFDKRLNAIKERYKNIEGSNAEAELTADLVGDYLFTDYDFVHNLSVENRNIFQKIYDEIKYLCKVVTAGSKEARELEKVKKAFDDAYRANVKGKSDMHYSISEIVDQSQKSYGVGVHLNSTLLDNLSPADRLGMVKEYVKELGGESFTAYDPNGNAVDITIAKPNARYENRNGKRIPVNKDLTTKRIGNEVKQESIALVDELIVTAEFDGSKASQYPHGWLDNNGQNDWEYWKTYIQDKNNTIWEATLNVANSADGEKILYDISPIKKVGQSVKSDTIPTSTNITENSENVKYSLSDSIDPDIRYSLTEYTAEEKKAHNKAVLDYFGKTYKWAETGYVLLDGSKLDLSGKHEGAPGGYRTVDHRDITAALGDDYGGDSYSGSLVQFMSEGNIRISPESDGINLSVKPTKAQEQALSDFISRVRGEVLLDIDDFDGYTVVSVEYPRGTHANKVLKDIREWFDNGTKPEVSNLSQFRYSLSDESERVFYTPRGVEVVQNPTNTEYRQMREDIYKEYPWLRGTGEAILRHTYDESGNEYYWSAYDGMHRDVEPYVNKRYNTRTSQHWEWWTREDKDDYPTDYSDIYRSMSDASEKPKQYGDWNVYGSDFGSKGDDFAPVIPTPDRSSVLPGEKHSVAEMFPDEPDVSQAEYDNLVSVKNALENRMLEMSETGDFTDLEKINEEWVEAKTRLAELETELADTDRIDSLSDSDAPPEMDAPYYESNPTTLTKKATADIVRDVRASLDVRNNEVSDLKDIVERYRNGEIRTRNQLVEALQNKFGTYTETETNERLADVKKAIRTTRINVSDTIKRGIADYAHVMRSNRGKVLFAKDGLAVDEVYKELQEQFPDLFNEDADMNPEDQLRHIIDIANTPHIEEVKHNKDIESIEEAADLIINGIGEFRYNQDLALSNKESKQAFESLMRRADKYAPMDDIAPVKKAPVKPTVKAPVKPVAKQQQTSGKVAQVLTEGSKKPKQPGIGGKLVSALVDKGAVFEKVSLDTKNMEVQAKWQYALPTNTSARAQYFMENGEAGVKSLKSVMKEVDKSGKTEKFYNYLYHVHNIDRMTLKDRFGTPNKAVFGDSVTADISRKKSAALVKQNPEFKQWAEDVYSINKQVRTKMVEGGLISQETADLWEQQYPHYVPTFRVDKNGANVNVPLDTNKTGVNNPVKRATGGSSDIEPLFNSMAQQIEQTYRAIARNSFGIELKNTLGTAIDSKPAAGVDEMIDTIEMQDELLKQRFGMNPTFTVFENGERVEFEITEDMYDALKPTNKILASRNPVIKWLGDNRRNLLTVWNPVFALYRNPIKDIQDVAINSQHAVRTYLNVPNAIYQMVSDGKYASEYHENGGKSNTYFDSRKNEFKAEDNLFKKAIGMPLRAIENAGEFIEEIPRLSEYIASRKEGRSIERSMLDAARVTTNFAAGGDFTKFLNSHGCTFLNASVQGASQHVRNFREATKLDGLKGFTKTLAKYVVAGVPGIILNSLLWDDDEEYEELSDYVKQNYFVVAKTEDGKFVRIPKGRTTAVMQNLMEQMQHLVTGDDEADFSTFFELFMNNIAPNNPLENNILAPIAQTLSNNAWYGGDIVPSRLQDLPAEEQFDESTDSISKWLGEKTGLSPIKLNYLLDQYSGGAGDVFLPMLTPEAESGDDSFMGNMLAPWKKEMTTDKVLNNKNPGDFYDLKDELEKMSNSRNATEEDKMKTMYMDAVSWEMGDLYAQKREIQSSDLPDSRKYEQVRELQEQINEIAKNAMGGYENVSIDGLYSEVGDKRFNQDAESGRWYEIKAKNSDGSDNKYYQKEQEVTKALGISYGEYWNNREEYNYAYDKPEQYTVAKAVGGYQSYRAYTKDLYALKADKDENGKSISGSKKEKVIDYVNNMDADYGTKIILFKSMYNADDTYNNDIIDYLNNRDDISYEEMETILKYLGFKVDSKGNISW